MLGTLLQVAVGGALGAVLRFLSVKSLTPLAVLGAPMPTLMVNVLGSFLMGLGAAWVLQRDLGAISPFLLTGILGGFTTFSAFSLEAVGLIEAGKLQAALLYITVSVVGSIVALSLGLWVARGGAV